MVSVILTVDVILWRPLASLHPQYTTYTCVRLPNIFLAGTATMPAHLPPSAALGSDCLASD